MLHIRHAGPDDLDDFHQLMLDEARHHGALDQIHTDKAALRRDGFGQRPLFHILLAHLDGVAVGYVSYTIDYSIWLGAHFMRIDDVFVAAHCRGQRIGQALMEQARQVAVARGLARIRWEVDAANEDAIRFYHRLGAQLRIKGVLTWSMAGAAVARED